jgi:hypothetical protein
MGLAESFLAIRKYTEFTVLCFSVRPNTFDGAPRISMFGIGETTESPRSRSSQRNWCQWSDLFFPSLRASPVPTIASYITRSQA